MSEQNETMKNWCKWMDWLDRLGYATAGMSLLLLGMVIFVHAWYVFIMKSSVVGLLPAGLKLLNDLLLVIILLELFRTVVRFLQTEVLSLEPYLSVGVIACTRRILTASAELSHLPEISQQQFYQYLMDVSLNVAVVMVLVVGVFLIRKHPEAKA